MEFRYQKYWIRNGLFIPFLIALFVLNDSLDGLFRSSTWYFVICTAICILLLVLVYRITAGMEQLYMRKGTCIAQDGTFTVRMGNRVTTIKNVREVMLFERSIWSSKFSLFQVKGDGGRIAVYGAPFAEGETLDESELYRVLEYVLSDNPDLVQETDMNGNPIEYWYTRK